MKYELALTWALITSKLILCYSDETGTQFGVVIVGGPLRILLCPSVHLSVCPVRMHLAAERRTHQGKNDACVVDFS